MDAKKLLAARAANLNAAPATDKKQPTCPRAELAFSKLAHRSVRSLHRQNESHGIV